MTDNSAASGQQLESQSPEAVAFILDILQKGKRREHHVAGLRNKLAPLQLDYPGKREVLLTRWASVLAQADPNSSAISQWEQEHCIAPARGTPLTLGGGSPRGNGVPVPPPSVVSAVQPVFWDRALGIPVLCSRCCMVACARS